MASDHSRRTYYDHEGPYRRIAAAGGTGWDDLSGDANRDSYVAVEQFLRSSIVASMAPGGRALDLGCGGGQVAMMLARRGFVAHGVDFAPTAIALARANARSAGLKVEFSEGDCLTLAGYRDASMDLVTDNHAFHCIVGRKDRRSFLRAAWRVLRPGGILFSEMMTREGDFRASSVDADPRTFIARQYNRYWAGRDEALQECRAAGFEVLVEQLKPQPDAPGVGDLLTIYARRPLNPNSQVMLGSLPEGPI